jgi:hypothetical protein
MLTKKGLKNSANSIVHNTMGCRQSREMDSFTYEALKQSREMDSFTYEALKYETSIVRSLERIHQLFSGEERLLCWTNLLRSSWESLTQVRVYNVGECKNGDNCILCGRYDSRAPGRHQFSFVNPYFRINGTEYKTIDICETCTAASWQMLFSKDSPSYTRSVSHGNNLEHDHAPDAAASVFRKRRVIEG